MMVISESLSDLLSQAQCHVPPVWKLETSVDPKEGLAFPALQVATKLASRFAFEEPTLSKQSHWTPYGHLRALGTKGTLPWSPSWLALLTRTLSLDRWGVARASWRCLGISCQEGSHSYRCSFQVSWCSSQEREENVLCTCNKAILVSQQIFGQQSSIHVI